MKNLLIIDDDYAIRESLCDLLRDEGYNVASAINGLDALNYLENSKNLPSLIFLDLSMPVMDGYAFRYQQMMSDRLWSIPLVMLSADGNLEAKAEKAGVTEFLRKPVEIDELLDLVNKYCQ